MQRLTLQIQSRSHSDLFEVTAKVQQALPDLGLGNGLVHLYTPHTTCGLTINENADPDVATDLLCRLEQLVPWSSLQDRHGEGNSAAHLKSSLLGCNLTLPVEQGRLKLGTWQGVYLCEFDGPRRRNLILTAMPL